MNGTCRILHLERYVQSWHCICSAIRLLVVVLMRVSSFQPFRFLFKYYPAVPEHYDVGMKHLKELTSLLKDGRIKPAEHRLMPGGLADIPQGFEEMLSGRVGGEKLVYRVGEDSTDNPAKSELK